MKRSLVFFSLFTLLGGCGDSEPSLAIDTFNVALAGFFIPFEAERRPFIVDAIANSNADILCLQEVWDQTDKVAIKDAAADTYPHTAFFEDDLDTPIDDATDQDGQVPPAPTEAPCAGEPLTSDMNALVDCLRHSL